MRIPAPKLKHRLFLCAALPALALLPALYLYAAGQRASDGRERLEAFLSSRVAGMGEILARQESSLKSSAETVARDPLWQEAGGATPLELSPLLASLLRKAGADLVFFVGPEGAVREAAWAGGGGVLEEARAGVSPSLLKARAGYVSVLGKICQVALAPLMVAGQPGWVGVGLTLPLTSYVRATPGLELAYSGRDGRWQGGTSPLLGEDGLRLANLGEGTELLRLTAGAFHARALRLDPEQPAMRLAVLAPESLFPSGAGSLIPAFLLSLVGALVLAGLLAWWLARSVSEPLEVVARAVRDLGGGGGVTLPSRIAGRSDEVGLVAAGFNAFSASFAEEQKQKEKALSKLEKYQAQLLDLNHRLAKKLFENRVILSLWKEQQKAEDTKDFLSRILEELLQGLPFHYGCIIIRPLAQIGPEVILARIERSRAGRDEISVTDILERSDRTLWLSSLSPEMKDFLLRVNQEAGSSLGLLQEVLTAKIEPDSPVRSLAVVSLRLAQGEQQMGSLHLITDRDKFTLNSSDEEFLLSVASQVSAALDNRSLQFANRVDSLTRLYNRGYMSDRLREEMMRTSRTNRPFTLMLLDIDHFKQVNDTYGHPAGDEVLLGLASLLKRSCRASDALCRYGGEELALILVDTPLAGAKTFAENLRRTIEAEAFSIPDGKTIRITASMGLAEFPSQAGSSAELIKRADEALYQAKREGRNLWRAFTA